MSIKIASMAAECKNNIGSPGKQGPSRNQLYIVCNF